MIPLLVAAWSAQPADPVDPDWLVELQKTGVSEPQLDAVRAIAGKNPLLGTGLKVPTRHPMSPEQCRTRRADAKLPTVPPENECGRAWMVPLPGEKSCIDQFEFPGTPCAYPVIWVRAAEAAGICEAVGKRLCDASEWEDGCAGSAGPVDDLSTIAGLPASQAQKVLRASHNRTAEQGWAYGPARRTGVCAAASTKNEACDGGSPKLCGSNTYPTGAFPDCKSSIGVYDQHGNAAEHMSLPLREDQRGKANGVTEMKGSWFIFDTYAAHPDWCRWRAPFWHGGAVRAADSHQNYHLGFRCCADRQP